MGEQKCKVTEQEQSKEESMDFLELKKSENSQDPDEDLEASHGSSLDLQTGGHSNRKRKEEHCV